MGDELSIGEQVALAMEQSDLAAFDALLTANPDEFRNYLGRCTWWPSAAADGNVVILEYLHNRGIDINESSMGIRDSPEGVVDITAHRGHVEATRWLIDRGAVLNQTVRGRVRCFPLSGAAMGGHLEVVKLLIERGAEVNAPWCGMTALDHAITYRKLAVYEYLRSVGAMTAAELGDPEADS